MEINVSEDLIDKLLIYMNNSIEEVGSKLSQFDFGFEKNEGEHHRNLELKPALESTGINDINVLHKIINKCVARGFIKRRYGGTTYFGLQLTEEGQGRALSAQLQKENKNPEEQGTIYNIGTLNAHGNTQIGNNNQQTNTIEKGIMELFNVLEKAKVDEKEVNGLKEKLKNILKHPAVTTLIGASISALLK